ncbi:MAG: LysR family transcriptional regulator [Tetrasphaera sp.]
MELSFRKLRYFVTAAEHGNITSAAQALNVSQPSISVAISQLEEELKAQLFLRYHSKGIAPTPIGRVALQQARDLLSRVDDFVRTVQEANLEIRGNLHVACLNNLSPLYFGEILAKFRNLHPEVTIQFRDVAQEELVEGVRLGEFELGVTYDLLPEDNITLTTLVQTVPYLLLSADHRFAGQKEITLHSLENDPCVLPDLTISRRYFKSLFDAVQITPNICFRTTTIEAARSFVANGLGYSILTQPIPSLEVFDGKRLVRARIAEPVPPVRIVCIQNSDLQLRPVAEAFKTFLQAEFSKKSGDFGL